MSRHPKASHDITFPVSNLASGTIASGGAPDILVAPPDSMISDVIENEKFMQEPIEVRFLETSNPSDPPMIEISIQTGGITGPMTRDENNNLKPGVPSAGGRLTTYVFRRGEKYTIPRFVYEAIAHSKVTTYKQVPHPNKPFECTDTLHHSFFYQFECLRDSNQSAKATAWREKVLNDPA